MFFRQTTSYMHAIFGSNSCHTDVSKEKAEHNHFNISYVRTKYPIRPIFLLRLIQNLNLMYSFHLSKKAVWIDFEVKPPSEDSFTISQDGWQGSIPTPPHKENTHKLDAQKRSPKFRTVGRHPQLKINELISTHAPLQRKAMFCMICLCIIFYLYLLSKSNHEMTYIFRCVQSSHLCKIWIDP